MPRTLSSPANRALRTIALWFGLIALTLQGLAPLCMGAPSAAGSGTSIVICTSHGSEIVRIDADGQPIPDAPHSDHGTCFVCLGCHLGDGAVAPGFAALPSLTLLDQKLLAFANAPVVTTSPQLAYDSRGPPTSNETIAS